jgi:uncharacterized cupredoxin-like copper-binding protein
MEETEAVMTRRRNMIMVGMAVLAAAGLGTGVAVAVESSSGQPPAPVASPVAYSGPGYAWYQSMMNGHYGSGGGMMGAGSDPGKIMGRLFASAPGPRVSPSQAAALGAETPAYASVNKAANTITFTTTTVRLAIVASPAGGPDETFRAAGLVNPRIIVPAGARVIIQLVNADSDTAHGLVVTAGDAAAARMPMMTARPAFTGSAVWFLGNPTAAGMHEGTVAFTATVPGNYRYLCPVPGHARQGMVGSFTVR